MILRKARMGDIEVIHALINDYAAKGHMLPRSRNTLYESLLEFTVACEDGGVVGCGSLHILWETLAEVRSLAIAADYVGKGLGTQIVETLVDEAKCLEIPRVFALTYRPAFFERCGFRLATKEDLPQKVWKECINCPKFPNCDEIALLKDLHVSTAG